MRRSSQVLLDRFQIRKSKNEKRLFINWLNEHLKQQGYELKKDNYNKHKDVTNLIVGDLKKADVILTAHYDTQAHSIFPMFMGFSNWISFLISQVWVMLPIGIISFFGGKYLALGLLDFSIKYLSIGLISLLLYIYTWYK